MKPIPVVFHIGPLQVHTYGIGLALTFWFGYRYFAKRLRDHGYPDAWFARAFIWIVIMSIVGARAVHVVANLKGAQGYIQNPGDMLAIWHGGLSSYGGLLGGVPTGLICARRWCPQLRLSVALDLIAPVLVIAWAMGRLLGPQLMYQGGGNLTHAWYGMAYAGQAGKRVPVPIIQALEDSVVYVIALWVERRIARRGGPDRDRRDDRRHALRCRPVQRRVRPSPAQHRGRHRRPGRVCRLRGGRCRLWRAGSCGRTEDLPTTPSAIPGGRRRHRALRALRDDDGDPVRGCRRHIAAGTRRRVRAVRSAPGHRLTRRSAGNFANGIVPGGGFHLPSLPSVSVP